MKKTLMLMVALVAASLMSLPALAQPVDSRAGPTLTAMATSPTPTNCASTDVVAKKSAKKGKHAEASAAFDVTLASMDGGKAPPKPAPKKPAPKKKTVMASTEPNPGEAGGEPAPATSVGRILRT